ncbi:MAG: hypothetical protein ACLQMF_13100 [Rectinemataceae bacterium]
MAWHLRDKQGRTQDAGGRLHLTESTIAGIEVLDGRLDSAADG